MSRYFQVKRRALQVLPQVLISLVLVYFAYHIVEGKRGITAWRTLTAELSAAQSERADVMTRREELEHRVNRLKSESLDPDLLEERARVMLNYGREGEVVILKSTLEDHHASGE